MGVGKVEKGKGYGCDCAFGWKGVDERKREGGRYGAMGRR